MPHKVDASILRDKWGNDVLVGKTVFNGRGYYQAFQVAEAESAGLAWDAIYESLSPEVLGKHYGR